MPLLQKTNLELINNGKYNCESIFNMKDNKKFSTLAFSIFILSVIYALMDNSTNFSSGFDFAKFAETVFRDMIKNIGALALVVLLFGSLDKK